MPKFAIGENLGIAENIPNVRMSKAFSPESESVILRYGEVRRLKGRARELLEAELTGTASVVSGSPTVTKVSGTVWYSSSAHYPAWGSDDLAAATGRTITLGGVDYTIKSVDSATQITLDTNYAGSSATVAFTIGTANQKVIASDGNPVIRYHTFESNEGGTFTHRFFGFTKAHIYLWDTTWTAWILKFTCASDCVHWSTETFNNKLVATNYVDKVQTWDGSSPGSAFAVLDNAANGIQIGTSSYLTKAKYVTSYENYLILGYVVVGGTVYPQTIYWCTLGNETDWNLDGSGDAGSIVYRVGKDFLKGFGHYRDQLIVFKDERYFPTWLVESSAVFNTSESGIFIGLLATDSVVNDKYGRLYWYANDYTIREINTPTPISKPIDVTARAISPTYEDYIQATYIDEYGEIWFAIPSTGSSTGNDKVLAFNPDEGTWEIHDIAIRAFGDWSQQTTYTIDTIPFSTIDGIGWDNIDSVENIGGYPFDICSDYSGYTYDLHSAETDDGSSYTGKLVLSTDLAEKRALSEFKRSSGAEFYFNGEGTSDFTIDVYAKEDNEASWQSLGSISLNGSVAIISPYLAWDLRFKHCLLKMEAANRFNFLGMIFDYEWDGDR